MTLKIKKDYIIIENSGQDEICIAYGNEFAPGKIVISPTLVPRYADFVLTKRQAERLAHKLLEMVQVRRMTHDEAGKGDTPRLVDKTKYDRNYLRIYGRLCSRCNGTGYCGCDMRNICTICDGLGYVPKEKK